MLNLEGMNFHQLLLLPLNCTFLKSKTNTNAKFMLPLSQQVEMPHAKKVNGILIQIEQEYQT